MKVLVDKTDDGFASVSTRLSHIYRSADIPKKLIDKLKKARVEYRQISNTIFAIAEKDYRKQMIAEGIAIKMRRAG